MKKILLSLMLLGPILVPAQISFHEIGGREFAEVSNSSAAFGDINGDGKEDLILSGTLLSNTAFTGTYFGNGKGEFNPDYNVSSILEDIENAAIALLDVNADGNLDALLTGTNNNSAKVARLYLGNGTTNWQLVSGTPFAGVDLGSIAYADIDGDNDLDLVISGQNSANQRVTNLYTNDGTGSFTSVNGTGLVPVSNSDMEFADVDGDSDQDLMITGFSATNQRVAQLYLNNGSGSFSLQTGSPFTGVVNSAIDFVDVDGDIDQDLVLTGQDATNQRIAHLYTNNGSGTFSLVGSTPFEGVANSSASHGDVDGDLDQDIVIVGLNASNQVISKLYQNNGNGVFSLSTANSIEGAQQGEVHLRDLNGNGKADMLLCGLNTSGTPISQIYLNDGSGRLTNANSQVAGLKDGKPDFADVDGDGDLDYMVVGRAPNNSGLTQLLLNNGVGAFEIDTLNTFDNLWNGCVTFGDIDGDNDQDVLVMGQIGSNQNSAKLYTNNGSGIFTENLAANLPALKNCYADFADIDGDSDLDLLMMGQGFYFTTALFINNGSGVFVEDTAHGIADYSLGRFLLEDLDFDNDLDLTITGWQGGSNQVTAKLYTNNGTGSFTEITSAPFTGARYSDIAAGDLDGDNDLDLVITGSNPSGVSETKVYSNDGLGNFTTISNHGLLPFSRGGVEFDDVDGDGDMDLVMGGNISTTSSVSPNSVIYENNGTGNFSLVTGLQLGGIWNGDLIMFDLDGDGDRDLLLSGDSYGSNHVGSVYRNTSQTCIQPILNPISLTNLSSCAGQALTIQLDSTSNLNGASNWVIYPTNCSGTSITTSNSNAITFTPAPNVTSFSIRAEGGCITSPGQCFPFSITQNAGPQVNAGTSQTVCLGDPILQNASGGTSYSWSNGVANGTGFTAAVVGSQTLVVTGYDATGCSDTAHLNITVNALPIVAAGVDQQVCQGEMTSLNATGATSYSWSHGVPNNTPFAPAPVGTNTYVVTGLNANGCSNLDTVLIEVLASPSLVPGSNQTICFGDSVVLSATSSGSISWSGGVQNGQVFAISAPGNYTYTVTALGSNGCSAIDSVEVDVIQVIASIQNGPNGLIASPAGAAYQWYDCQTFTPVSGATNQVFLPSVAGDYAVEVNESGCIDSSACFNFQGVGLDESLIEELRLFPNPSQGRVRLESVGHSLEGTTIQVMNTIGQVVYNVDEVQSETVTLNLTGLKKGIYLIRVNQDEVPLGMEKLVIH